MLIFFKNLLNYNGRANRKEYIYRCIKLFALYIIIAILMTTLRSLLPENIFLPIFSITGIPLIILITLAGVANMIRRCHDLNLPSYVAIVYLISNFLPGRLFPYASPVTFIIFLAWLCLFFLKGTTGPNKYGDDPLQDPISLG